MPLTTLAEIIHASRALSPAERLQLLDAMWEAEHPDAWPALSPEWLTDHGQEAHDRQGADQRRGERRSRRIYCYHDSAGYNALD